MRNNNNHSSSCAAETGGGTLGKGINEQIKGLARLGPPRILGALKDRIEDDPQSKKSKVEPPKLKPTKPQTAATIYADIDHRKKKTVEDLKNSIRESKMKFLNSDVVEVPRLNPDHVKRFCSVTNTLDAKNSCSNDSRSTGGGKVSTKVDQPEIDDPKKIPRRDDPKKIPRRDDPKKDRLVKKPSFENSISPVVSFKTKGAHHRKPVHSTTKITVSSSTVAALAQKFNDIIKENNHHKKDEPKPDEVIIKSALETRDSKSLKIGNQIKSCPSIILMERLAKPGSPLAHKKIFSVKSDPKRKNSVKKRLNECAKSDSMSSANSDRSDNDYLDSIEIKKSSTTKRRPSFKTSPTRHVVGVVRATVQKFESEKPSIGEANKAQQVKVEGANSDGCKVIKEVEAKPKIPEKKHSVSRTKNVVLKDGKPKMKILKRNIFESNQDSGKEIRLEPVSENISKEESTVSQEKSERENKVDATSKTSTNEASENISFIDRLKKSLKGNEKSFLYEKIHIRKLLDSKKLQLPKEDANVADSVDVDKVVCDSNKQEQSKIPEVNVNENSKIVEVSVSNELKNSNEVTKGSKSVIKDSHSQRKPNNSFLWRTNPSNILKEKSNCTNKVYDSISLVKPQNEDVIVSNSVEPIRPKEEEISSDDVKISLMPEKPAEHSVENKEVENGPLLQRDKDIILNSDNEDDEKPTDLEEEENPSKKCIIEAINMFAISDTFNIRNEIALLYPPDDYETFDIFKDDENENIDESFSTDTSSKRSYHSKANCPLPELPESPKGNEENIYQCLSELHSQMGTENYEYCHSGNAKVTNKDEEDGYEYCKSPKSTISNVKMPKPLDSMNEHINKSYSVCKSDSITSSMGYEKISSIYEQISKESARNKDVNYYDCNYDDIIYDTIKHSDTASISNCYESISESPHYKFRSKRGHAKDNIPLIIPKHIAFDTISNFSQSTISSVQKTNSIYDQRSIGGEFGKANSSSANLVYGKSSSEVTLSDRSEDWEDMSDQDTTIIIVREKSKGRHSPTSWSRKVRHQWNDAGKRAGHSDLFITSSSVVYLTTPPKSLSDDRLCRYNGAADVVYKIGCDSHRIARCEDLCGLAVLKILVIDTSASFETQEITVLIDSSDGEHIYEPLSHPESVPSKPIDDDFDSFESDFDSDYSMENHKQTESNKLDLDIVHAQLPDPPSSSNIYTLTRFATAAGKKMKQLKNNLTKSTRKKSADESVKTPTSESKSLFTISKTKKNNASNENIDSQPSYQNVGYGLTKEDIKVVEPIVENGSLQNSPNTDTSTNSSFEKNDKASRKPYLSFKSKFKRSTSMSSSNQKLSPSLSSISNSTFYLDEMTVASDTDLSQSNEIVEKVFPTITPMIPNNRLSQEQINNNINEKTTPENNKTELKNSANKTKRLSVGRPTVAPPSPPSDDMKKENKDKRIINAASWYAECGLFKNPEINGALKDKSSTTSWYAEIGLYQASNVSTSSGTSSTLSGSGTCSTTTAFSSPSTPTPPLGMFNQEPLYQFYDADKLESVCRDLGEEYDVYQIYEDISKIDKDASKPIQRPSAMSFINPKKGPSRTLWSEITEVKESAIFDTLSPKQKQLQEAKFEIITSEASYLNSLTVLESQYINNANFQDEKILTKIDKQILFSNILPVKKCSERLMAQLESCWQDSILLHGLCKIIKDHAEKYFEVYVTFCENQIHLVKTLKKLKSDAKFNEIAQTIQSEPACQSLSLDSFLLIPMQRVTRYPLLMDAVLKRLEETSDEYRICCDTLSTLNKVVSKCNEAARNMERLEEMFLLYSQIEFPGHIKGFPLLSVNERNKKKITDRWLIRSGELVQLIWRGDDQSKLTFGRKTSKTPLHLFLFTDLLIVTKKKSNDGTFTVIDYCARSLVEMTLSDMMAQPLKEASGKFMVLLTMLENHEKKTVEMLLSCANETDRQRWIEAFSPPPSNPNEKIYEVWDCPQVAALYHYESQQPDELTLYPGDIMNVNKKTAEGWYQGERIRDGECGWFPGNYTVEIGSSHVRSKNLKQRYRLLALPGSYLGKKKTQY